MDFRYYVYKTNKQFNMLISLKIFMAIFLFCLIFFIAIAYVNATSGFVFDLKNAIGMTAGFQVFDLNNFLVPNVIIIVFIIIVSILYLSIISLTMNANKNIKLASNFYIRGSNMLFASLLLDLVLIGFIIILAFRKDLFIKVYNAGIDA